MARQVEGMRSKAARMQAPIGQCIGLLALLCCTAAAQISETADPRYMRYVRDIGIPHGAAQACAVLDASVFANASPSLRDLRLYATPPDREIPYVITLSEPQQPDTDKAEILRLESVGQSLRFDLRMPQRPYTEVTLQLDAHDFVALAQVRGADELSEPGTPLGTFTLFDLSARHLSRNTTISLPESRFRFLHVQLQFVAAEHGTMLDLGSRTLLSALVPPSREAQTLYTVAAETTKVFANGTQTLASLVLPERVPAERLTVILDPKYLGNFSRKVHIFAHPQGDSQAASSESSAGTILRVHLQARGREIKYEQLSIPVTIGANLQGQAVVEVAIDNGDEPPLPVKSVRLDMRQRRLCFEVSPTLSAPLVLYYGDPAATAARYAFARTFRPSPEDAVAQLGPEHVNPAFRPRIENRPISRRHPEMVWVAVLVFIGLFAIFAFRLSNRPSPHR